MRVEDPDKVSGRARRAARADDRESPRAIEARSEFLAIGTLATLAEIERHPIAVRGYAALAQARATAASAQIAVG